MLPCYSMFPPDGEKFWGRQDYQTITPIDQYTALDGFCDAEGNLVPGMPRAHWTVDFTDVPAGTLVTTLVTYSSAEDVQKVIDIGMQDGLTSAMERLDVLLEEIG